MITLLTDFGSSDYFIPAVKGVILSINPQVRIVDLTHEIPAYDIAAGSFTLGACYEYFPPGTIHFAVVDPGVGSSRRPIVVEAAGALFVGPDNGLFTSVYERQADFRVYRIERVEYLRPTVSPTFHGRDIFAPVAAWLSRGVAPTAFGELVLDPVRLPDLRPRIDHQTGRLSGRIIHIDRYGNCVTSLGLNELPLARAAEYEFEVAGVRISQICRYFGEAAGSAAAFAYPGSAGYWEIGCWCDSAAQQLQVLSGDEVLLVRRSQGA